MKTTHFYPACLALAFLIFATPKANAQAPASHVFHVVTWYSVAGLDSVARAERAAVYKEYHDKVNMKNELLLHSWTMGHFFTEDSREFVSIDEYATFADIEKAFNRSTELEKQAWPDAKQREAFMKKMASYFTHHKDAIYNGMPSLTK